MRLRELIKAPKTITDEGAWKSGKKMPKTAFPLSKNRSFVIRSKYRWRLVKFKAKGREFRLLIAYRPDIETYLAYLGQMSENDMVVVCIFEFHSSHSGWHAHTTCDDFSTLDAGRTQQPKMKRLCSKNQSFDMDDSKALYTAYKAFGLLNEKGGLL